MMTASGARALAVPTPGQLSALHVTPADGHDHAQVGLPCDAVHEATGDSIELTYVDQGDAGEEAFD